jgi:glyceraldehyde 3-phosphate dehydrogenase
MKMAKTKIGINGFGRIGRQVLKALIEKHGDKFDIVGINDLVPAATNAHLFKYDSTYGAFKGTISVDGTDLVVNGDKLKVFSERDPAAIPCSPRRTKPRATWPAAQRKSSSARPPRAKTSPS